jgi:hypothetical protein
MSDIINVYVVVEGQTEQTFVRDVLGPSLHHKKVYLYPALIGTPGHKGGNVCFDRAKKDIGMFLKQQHNVYVTTMFDYFRIEAGWPGKSSISNKISASKKAYAIEQATCEMIGKEFAKYNSDRFIPYVEMHEFEAILFSNSEVLAKKIGVKSSIIEDILDECVEPEEINDGPKTAPSKRLMSICNYRKVAMGTDISRAIGIRNIREKCPHFDEWLLKLESLRPL